MQTIVSTFINGMKALAIHFCLRTSKLLTTESLSLLADVSISNVALVLKGGIVVLRRQGLDRSTFWDASHVSSDGPE